MSYRQYRLDSDDLREFKYQYDLDRWGDWQRQQARLQELLPQAIDVLEETLDKGGPEATKVAMALVKLTDIAKKPLKPERALIELSPEEEIAAGLPAGDNERALPDCIMDPNAIKNGRE
jgi:hypothetical protein